MGQLLDLVRALNLDQPETWLPGGAGFAGPVAPPTPDFSSTNETDGQGHAVVREAWPRPEDPAQPWGGNFANLQRLPANLIDFAMDTARGFTGLGDQGPAGPTWKNAVALGAAMLPLKGLSGLKGALAAEQAAAETAERFPRFTNAIKAYHGTAAEFEHFVDPQAGKAVWFTKDPAEAARYSEISARGGGRPRVLAADVELRRDGIERLRELSDLPQKDAIEQLKREGYDGFTEGNIVAVFQGGQAKIRPTVKAYHGSPHDFEKFSLAKIGTGEGAQAYGHGLYFAEAEATAKAYRDDLGKVVASFGGQPTKTAAEDMAHSVMSRMKPGSTTEDAMRMVDEWADAGVFRGKNEGQSVLDVKRAIADNFGKPLDKTTQGRMYEVNIKADPAHFLDWDAPLKDQPANVKAVANDLFRGRLDTRDVGGGMVDVFEKGPGGRPGGSLGVFPKDKVAEVLASPADYYPYKGERLYDEIAQDLGTKHQVSYGTVTHESQPAASARLKEAGIPGIKYLDQGSRGPDVLYDVGAPRADFGPYSHFTSKADAEKHLEMLRGHGFHDAEIKTTTPKQTRNYVVFDDALIDILKKYGLSAATIGLLHRALTDRSEHEQ